MNRIATITCILLLALLGGCGGMSPFQASPSAVVKSYYQHCNAGEYSKVEELLATDSKKLVHGELGALAGGMQGICKINTRDGTYIGIDIKSETIRGEGAVVVSDIHYKDKDDKLGDKSSLVRENGSWKISTAE